LPKEWTLAGLANFMFARVADLLSV